MKKILLLVYLGTLIYTCTACQTKVDQMPAQTSDASKELLPTNTFAAPEPSFGSSNDRGKDEAGVLEEGNPENMTPEEQKEYNNTMYDTEIAQEKAESDD